MGLTVIFILLNPKTSKKLLSRCKSMELLAPDLRNLPDSKVFSKNFKNCLLVSVVSDPNYIVNNAYDYIYTESSTRVRKVGNSAQTSLLDQVLTYNDGLVRSVGVLAPVGKSDHVTLPGVEEAQNHWGCTSHAR